MKITEVRVTPKREGKLRAFVSITIDDCFVVRGLKIIEGGEARLFVAMPSRRRSDNTYQDIAHPINAETRKYVEDAIVEAYEREEGSPSPEHTTRV